MEGNYKGEDQRRKMILMTRLTHLVLEDRKVEQDDEGKDAQMERADLRGTKAD